MRKKQRGGFPKLEVPFKEVIGDIQGLCRVHGLGFAKNRGAFSGGPYNKDCSLWGLCWGPHAFRKLPCVLNEGAEGSEESISAATVQANQPKV